MKDWETPDEIRRLAGLRGPEVAQLFREGQISKNTYLSVLSQRGIPLWSGDPRLRREKP